MLGEFCLQNEKVINFQSILRCEGQFVLKNVCMFLLGILMTGITELR